MLDPAHWQDWYWFVAGTVLIVLEVFVFGAVLLWLGIAVIAMGIITMVWPGIAWQTQLWIYMGIAVVSLAVGLAIRRRYVRPHQDHLVNLGSARFVGQQGLLDRAIVAGRGSMKRGDTVWPVTGPDLAAGTRVVVTASDGITLTVVKAGEG